MGKRILIISHNPFSDYNNMGKTLSNLFCSFNDKDIAQLYFSPQNPNVKLGCKFYKITDMDMLKSCFGLKKYGGVVKPNNEEVLDDKPASIKEKLYALGSKKIPIVYLLRDAIWRQKAWFSESLKKWINDFDPKIIFYASGDSGFSFKIAMKISDEMNIPLVTYFCDDFYFYSKPSISPFYYIYKSKIRKKIENTIKASLDLVFISNLMQQEYYTTFKNHGHVVMTPSAKILDKPIAVNNSPLVLSFIGNIVMRTDSLIQIGNIIEKINIKNEKINFNIYTNTSDMKLIKEIKSCRGIQYKGSLDFDGVRKEILNSDVILHVESFKTNLISRTKHSISTKIPESLGLGRCIFAYGPSELASIKYIDQQDAGFVCTHQKDLESVLLKIIENESLRKEYMIKGLKLASINHKGSVNSQKIKTILNKSIKEDTE
jgi:hypothetical protein